MRVSIIDPIHEDHDGIRFTMAAGSNKPVVAKSSSPSKSIGVVNIAGFDTSAKSNADNFRFDLDDGDDDIPSDNGDDDDRSSMNSIHARHAAAPASSSVAVDIAPQPAERPTTGQTRPRTANQRKWGNFFGRQEV